MKNILVVAAHPDDELLGEGGTIRLLVNRGICARAIILGEGITSRSNTREDSSQLNLEKLKKDAQKATKIIGYSSIDFCDFPDNRFDGVNLLNIVKVVEGYIEKYVPDTIFTHHHGDLNIDHQKTCEAVLTACRPIPNHPVKRVYSFETPSSTEWDFTYREPFCPTLFFDISETLETKLRGMECYRSESTTFPHPRSTEALRALAAYRGSQVGTMMAEGFVVLREIFE